jgi:carboxyl-terminal processing protease
MIRKYLLIGFIVLVGLHAQGDTPPLSLSEPSTALRTQLGSTLNHIDQLWLYEPSIQSLNLMVQGYISNDPHARVLTTQQNDALERVTQGQRGGIGVMLKQEATGVVVEQTIAHMPAQQAGIRAGDMITHIDNIPLTGAQTYIQAQSLLEGPIGSRVVLQISRPEGPLKLSIMRQSLINYQTCYDRIGKIGLITVSFFDAPTHYHMIQAIENLTNNQEPCAAYVIDIRDAYGGLVTSAVQAASLWVPYHAIIAKVTQKNKKSEVHRNARQPLITPTTPIVIMVNEQTASAAELFACALKEQAQAIVIGTPTFGKATVQSVIRLNSYSTVKITTATIKSGKGTSWEASGIKPDIATPLRAGPEGRLLVANALDALLEHNKSTPSRGTLIKQLGKRLPKNNTSQNCTNTTG